MQNGDELESKDVIKLMLLNFSVAAVLKNSETQKLEKITKPQTVNKSLL